ncbi:hypothetical protein SAMD00019534_124310, partial [Acytostelium subglobosum LB1]|uniref:hypothetical protein n=1 Tax=Acytostelium subglobosum LB1 TaxID=1410327 RepID=UPI000644A718
MSNSKLWEYSLLDCCSVPLISLITCTLCPCQVARQRATLHSDFGLSECLFTFCCLPFAACRTRANIRNRYDIPGSMIGDCLCMCYCGCCATVQQTRELEVMGDKPAGLFMPRPDKQRSSDGV